ncbi:hypothetical protein [Streptococcus pluranimalium]|uniref:hypothetical protein n=1 Tax=Streptococcus pluranimalium TaxID=82348 RepID=UPI003F68ED52
MARLIEWQERDSTVPKYMKRIFDELVSMKFEFHQLEGVQGFIYLGTNLTEKEKEKIPLCDKFPDHRGQVWYYTKNLNKNDGEAKNVMYHIVNQKEILDRSKKN